MSFLVIKRYQQTLYLNLDRVVSIEDPDKDGIGVVAHMSDGRIYDIPQDAWEQVVMRVIIS